MKLEKIYEKINKGLGVTESQVGRVLNANRNLDLIFQKNIYDEEGNLDASQYILVPRVGTTTPCKPKVYII